jgi:tetratricopeptide (TPR) repeat protein
MCYFVTLPINVGAVRAYFKEYFMAENEFDPTDPESCRRRGSGYLGTREWDKALADFDEAVRLDPDNALSYSSRGGAYSAKGDYDRAVKDYDKAIHRSPNNPSIRSGRGDVYTAKGDYDRAIADFDESIRLGQLEPFADDPGPTAYIGRGVAYASKGDFDKAVTDLEAALKISPEDLLVKEMIALVQKQRAKGGALAFPGPNLMPMSGIHMQKRGLTGSLIFMGIGAAIGIVIGTALGNPLLAVIFGGFFGTLQSTVIKIIGLFKQASGGVEVVLSLLLSLIIAPVWFIIKLVKRLKALSWARTIEKALSKEVDPSGVDTVLELVDYCERI